MPRMENNTLESQLLSEFCLQPSNLRFTDCRARQILSMSGILTRFPCSANKNACPIVQVAHLPQKPCYVILGTITVGFGNSAFADAHLHCKPLHLTYQRFCCLALLRQNRVRSIKKPLLPCYLADKRSLVFSVYSVSVYAKTTFLFK